MFTIKKTTDIPDFLGHFNPDNRMKVITSCVKTGDTMEREYTFLMYFWSFGELSDDYEEIALHFDIEGFYQKEIKSKGIGYGFDDREYIVTMYPITTNSYYRIGAPEIE